jgi:hypothetical protein
MKVFFVLFLLAICILSQSFLIFSGAPALYPVFDPQGVGVPRNLRTVHQVEVGKSSLNFQGLNHLRVSGSGQFSEKNFTEMMRYLPISPQQLIVLDLRQESHGFINGKPISWTDGNYNYGNLHRTRSEVEADEYQRLRLAAQSKRIVVNPVDEPKKLTVQTVNTERAFVEGVGSTYIRLPVTDHNRPTHEVIDQFVELVKTLPADQWLHFHCRAGKGRTTTFLTLFDIMKNAQQVSLNDILARQQFIGGSDLNEFQKKEGERKRAAEARIEFVQQFYLYCQQVPNFEVSWSNWIEQQHSTLVINP